MLIETIPPHGGMALSGDTRALAAEAASRLKQAQEIERFLLAGRVESGNPAFGHLLTAAESAAAWHAEAQRRLLAAVPEDERLRRPAEPRRRRRRRADEGSAADGREGA